MKPRSNAGRPRGTRSRNRGYGLSHGAHYVAQLLTRAGIYQRMGLLTDGPKAQANNALASVYEDIERLEQARHRKRSQQKATGA